MCGMNKFAEVQRPVRQLPGKISIFGLSLKVAHLPAIYPLPDILGPASSHPIRCLDLKDS